MRRLSLVRAQTCTVEQWVWPLLVLAKLKNASSLKDELNLASSTSATLWTDDIIGNGLKPSQKATVFSTWQPEARFLVRLRLQYVISTRQVSSLHAVLGKTARKHFVICVRPEIDLDQPHHQHGLPGGLPAARLCGNWSQRTSQNAQWRSPGVLCQL